MRRGYRATGTATLQLHTEEVQSSHVQNRMGLTSAVATALTLRQMPVTKTLRDRTIDCRFK